MRKYENVYRYDISCKLGGKKGNTIERIQFPLTPAYAFTDFKAQGQTIESVIVDLAKPPSGGLTGFNAYVALSRSRGRETIRLLRDFDEKLFTVHPNEQLRREDQRLEALEKKTEERFEAGEFRLLTGSCVPDLFTCL
jgi:ATP-dependent exoDNAse (exonuclease V) alpha subunit